MQYRHINELNVLNFTIYNIHDLPNAKTFNSKPIRAEDTLSFFQAKSCKTRCQTQLWESRATLGVCDNAALSLYPPK